MLSATCSYDTLFQVLSTPDAVEEPLGYRLEEQKMLIGSEESQKVSGKVLLCRNKRPCTGFQGTRSAFSCLAGMGVLSS